MAAAPDLLATLSATLNMYLSSIAMTRVKVRPWPLSQLKLTGWPGDNTPPALCVHTVWSPGMLLAELLPIQPNSA